MARERWALSILLLVATACTSTVPAGRESVLYRDLERIVTYRATSGWEIDRLEVHEALGDALLSVCPTEPALRISLLRWIDARIVALGGPVDTAWRARGRKLDRVDELLTLTRIRALLLAATAAAPDDCPFWLEPDPDFAGRQIADDRWQLELAGGGKGILGLPRSWGGHTDLSGGGAGRVSLIRHVGRSWTLGFGLELGASLDFVRDDQGQRDGVVFAYDAVLPLILRYRRISSLYELELGPLAHGVENQDNLTPGVHVGISFGGRALRQRWFVPGAQFALSYEQTMPSGDEEPLYLFKLGLRVSIDIDM